jgi:hypothetical protein
MNTQRSMTRSPKALARMALRVARRALPAYSTKFSRQDFTQRQLFTILALKQFFRTDYRGIVGILADTAELRRLLELTRLPHYTTLQKAHDRLLKKGLLTGSSPLFSALQSSAA